MMNTRTTATVKFRDKLGIDQHDPILTKEQWISSKIMKVFSNKEIMEQYLVLNEKIYFYFLKHRLAIETDDLGHLDRDEEDEIERQKKLEKYLGCTFIRINPDEKDFDVFSKLGRIRSCIDKSNKKLIEKSTKSLLLKKYCPKHQTCKFINALEQKQILVQKKKAWLII